MYMTVLKMDANSLRNRAYLIDINDMEYMHKWLTSQVDSTRAEAQLLYRIDKTDDAIYMYVQSADIFPEKHFADAGFIKVKSFELQEPGDEVFFKILTSVTKRKDEKSFYVKEPEKRIEWLKTRLAKCMSNINLHELKENEVYISKKKGDRPLHIRGAEFIGTGHITDKAVFMNMVAMGIGKAKNYGMGLMLYKDQGLM